MSARQPLEYERETHPRLSPRLDTTHRCYDTARLRVCFLMPAKNRGDSSKIDNSLQKAGAHT